jgi:hypothetical protein
VKKHAASLFAEWHDAERRICVLREKQRALIMDMRDRQHPLILKKGRMRPGEVVVVDFSTAERVKIRRLDTGKTYWVSFYFLGDRDNGAPRDVAGKQNGHFKERIRT